AGGLHRLAGLLRDQPCGLVMAPPEPHCHTHEDLRPLVRRQRLAHCCVGGVNRALRLVRPSLRDPPDDLAGVRRANLQPLACLDPLAGDEKLPFHGGCGHAASLDSRRWASTSATHAAAASRSRTRSWGRARSISFTCPTTSRTSCTAGSRRTGATSTSASRRASG